MNKIGKRGKANIESRKKIAEIAEEIGLDRCELCGSTYGIAPAHKERREFYKGSVEELSRYKNWICLCVVCHEKIDNRSKTSEIEKNDIFNKLRGYED